MAVKLVTEFANAVRGVKIGFNAVSGSVDLTMLLDAIDWIDENSEVGSGSALLSILLDAVVWIDSAGVLSMVESFAAGSFDAT